MARLIWTEPALQDLEQIADYIALDHPVAARRLVQKVFDRAEQLQEFPEMCPFPLDLVHSRYRHLIVRPLRIFYRIQEDIVFIVYVMRSERLLRLSDLEQHDRQA